MFQRHTKQPATRQCTRRQIIKNYTPLVQSQPRMSHKQYKHYDLDSNQSNQHLRKQQHSKYSQYNHDQKNIYDNVNASHKYPEKTNYSPKMIEILLQQNSNLKEQNKYLHGKLKEISSKQSELYDTILQYETIMAALNSQNQQLQKEVLYFSQIANNKADKLGLKLGKLIGNNQHIRYHNNDIVQEHQMNKQQQKYNRARQSTTYALQPQNLLKRIQSEYKINNKPSTPPTNPTNLIPEDINSQFQNLLYACRIETNPQKRKELRRRLVSIAHNNNRIRS